MAGEKTEKATPKKRREAREKGQVARSPDLQGAVVLHRRHHRARLRRARARPAHGRRDARRDRARSPTPSIVSKQGIGVLMMRRRQGRAARRGADRAGLRARRRRRQRRHGRLQARPARRSSPTSRRINPRRGRQEHLRPQRARRDGQVARQGRRRRGHRRASRCCPRLPEFGGMVGISPTDFGSILATDMGSLVKRAAFAYLFIGLADFAWQKRRTEKSHADGQAGGHATRPRTRTSRPRCASMIRRRQMEALAQAHDGRRPDRGRRRHQPDALLRRPALRHEPRPTRPRSWPRARTSSPCASASSPPSTACPVVPDPPLARGLYASVEVGHLIPEEFFGAVAAVLAFVYRTAARRAAA